MDVQEFDRLVSEDVKNMITPEKADYLRLPSNQEKWRESLLRLINNLDEQIEEIHKNETTATENLPSHMITDHKIVSDERQTKISRFRFYVNQRLSEAERMIALSEDAQDPDLKLADFLSRAILEHKSLMGEYDFEPTPIDKALWQSIEGRWAFIGLKSKLEHWV
jgi:hypothetical protein